jgi:hypothetical protein
VIARIRSLLILPLVLVLVAAAAVAQAPQRLTGTASVKRGAASASLPVTFTITRMATNPERESVLKALKEGGTAAVQKALRGMPDAGVLQLGDTKTPIKYVSERPIDSGRLLTIATAEPVLFLGGGLPAAKPRAGYEVGLVMLTLDAKYSGTGEFAPAASVGVDSGALVIQDYGATVVWLTGVAPAR